MAYISVRFLFAISILRNLIILPCMRRGAFDGTPVIATDLLSVAAGRALERFLGMFARCCFDCYELISVQIVRQLQVTIRFDISNWC